jgi:hypothetical protein
MGQAVIGLVGVVVGALLSGGATYLMAKRAEANKARAAARLLEAELRPIAQGLDVLYRALERSGTKHVRVGQVVRHLPDSSRLWNEHKSLLAEVLDDADWYALASAYESIDIINRFSELLPSNSNSDTESVSRALLMHASLLVDMGVQAVSHLAGREAGSPRAERAQVNLDALVADLMRVESSAAPGTADATGMAAQESAQNREHRA